MILKREVFENVNIDISQYGFSDLSNILFLDIETTGLTARSSSIYMIGLTSLENDKWTFTGIFAESPAAEKEVLLEFEKILCNYKTLIHFNGNRFDLPFIKERAKANGLNISFEEFESIDLYKKISSFKHLLGIGNCKQKTIESFLGISREDKYSGGELISVYKDYVDTKDQEFFDLLYSHNHDDLLGMLEILPVFIYEKLSSAYASFDTIQEHEFQDYEGNLSNELMLEYTLPFSLPSPVSINRNGVFLSLKGEKGYLRIPIIYGEMKHYFDDIKNYYYLPKEDMAIHKSVAEYVDKEYRQKATKENCYIKRMSTFIPAYLTNSPLSFKKDYSSNDYFMELSEEFISDKELLEEYFHTFLCNAYKKR